MALSYDNPMQAQSALDAKLAVARAFDQAHTLAQKLILFERNEDPHPERNLPNPAAGVYVRRLRPMVQSDYRIDVDEECKRHNDLVANLGVMPK